MKIILIVARYITQKCKVKNGSALMERDGETAMSNLEHLIENGLCRLNEGKSYREWRAIMQQDRNWEGNQNITIDNLWEICQYVIFTWEYGRTVNTRCRDCEMNNQCSIQFKFAYADDPGDWFCAYGERKDEA